MEDPLPYPFLQILQIEGSGASAFGLIAGAIILVILLICSALISGAEVAFFSLTTQEKEALREKNSRSSRTTLDLLEKPRRLLATILIVNNTINIAIIILSTLMIDPLLASASSTVRFVVQVVCVTFLILLIGEVTPKVYATRHALSFSAFMAMPVFILSKIFAPLSSLLILTSKYVETAFKPAVTNISVDELSHALELTNPGDVHDDEQQILKGIVKFGNTEVRQIMQPRLDVTAFDVETNFPELLHKILDAGFSRVPVYRENIDNVVGILYIKDLLKHIDADESFDWQHLLRTPFFVPENKKIDDLLKEFQEKKIHLAVVVDEYGGASGVVSMEDIIEEIVGDISDEFDDDELNYSRLDGNNFLFEGRTPLNDLYRVLKVNGDEFEKARGDSDTLAGFLLELAGRIPVKNTVIPFGSYSFVVEAADKRRIKTVKVTIQREVEDIRNDKSR